MTIRRGLTMPFQLILRILWVHCQMDYIDENPFRGKWEFIHGVIIFCSPHLLRDQWRSLGTHKFLLFFLIWPGMSLFSIGITPSLCMPLCVTISPSYYMKLFKVNLRITFLLQGNFDETDKFSNTDWLKTTSYVCILILQSHIFYISDL